MELLVGCGNDKRKKMWLAGDDPEWSHLVTLDMDKACHPNVIWDLNEFPYPFDDNLFDEVHAYEVLEHCGSQGNWYFFFGQFSEFWRILKPGGRFIATVPASTSPWAWADPGHTRIIATQTLTYLSQAQYEKQVGNTCMTDYRAFYKADFDIVFTEIQGEHMGFVLVAKKGTE